MISFNISVIPVYPWRIYSTFISPKKALISLRFCTVEDSSLENMFVCTSQIFLHCLSYFHRFWKKSAEFCASLYGLGFFSRDIFLPLSLCSVQLPNHVYVTAWHCPKCSAGEWRSNCGQLRIRGMAISRRFIITADACWTVMMWLLPPYSLPTWFWYSLQICLRVSQQDFPCLPFSPLLSISPLLLGQVAPFFNGAALWVSLCL